MFKFKLNQTVWYLNNNVVHSASILSRKYVDNLFPKSMQCTKVQEKTFARFGNEGVFYATIHGEYSESELYESAEALSKNILED